MIKRFLILLLVFLPIYAYCQGYFWGYEFGVREIKSTEVNYLSETDGLVIVIITANNNGKIRVYGYAGETSPSELLAATTAVGEPVDVTSFTMSIKKGEQWTVIRNVNTGSSNTVKVYWIPIQNNDSYCYNCGFGNREIKLTENIYLAETDGLVITITTSSNNGKIRVYGYAGETSPSELLAATTAAGEPVDATSFTMPVKAGEYWTVVKNTNIGSSNTVKVYWIPIQNDMY